MIYNSDDSIRRIFTFPAVHPCENASPATLLASLISLAGKISGFKTQTLVSAKRDARSAIRLVEVLLVFLEELQELICKRNCLDSDSIAVSLSEIHVVFQRIRFLIEDCARQDARLWMLVKSDEVANQFRVVGRDLATALEIFPVSFSDLSDESKDCVEFVARQGRRLGFGVESGVNWALNLLDSVMKGFEKGVIPDPNNLKRFLNYLGVWNWEDCEGEIKFLEGENENSLLGFMIYCRCVVFNVLCREVFRRNVCENKDGGVEVLLNSLNKEDLRCPISLEIMSDPVTISTGHTYDRDSIAKWFKAGNPSCPKTGERLQSLEWVPNSSLKKLARQYAISNGIEVPKSDGSHRCVKATAFVASPAYEEAIRMASDFLTIKLAIGTVEEKNKSAYEIRLMTKRNAVNRALVVESGTIPYLLNLLLLRDSSVQENSLAALLNLSKHSSGKSAIVQSGGLQLIVKVLNHGMKLEAKQHAAAVLFYLSSIEENRRLIGAIPEVIPALMELIIHGGDRGKKNALVTIFGLLMHPNNHQSFLGANLVPILAGLLKSLEKEDLITDSLAILSVLAENPEGAGAIVRGETLEIVIAIFCSSNCRSTREHSVSLLQALCANGRRDVVQVLAKNPALIGSLYALVTQGTPRASKKARSLIGILQEFSEKGSAAHQVPRGRFIHVW